MVTEKILPATVAVLEASQLISDKSVASPKLPLDESVAVTKFPLSEKHKLRSAPTSNGPMIKLDVVKEIPSDRSMIRKIPVALVDAISSKLHDGYTTMVGPHNLRDFEKLHGEVHGRNYEVVLVCQRKECLTIPSGPRKIQIQPHPVSDENVLGLDRLMYRGTQSEQVTTLHYACEWILVSVEMYEQVKHMFEAHHMLLIANDLQMSMPKKGKAATVDMSTINGKILKVVDYNIKEKVICCVPESMTYGQTNSSSVHRHHWCWTNSRGCFAAYSNVQLYGISAMYLLRSGSLALSKDGQSTAICETELDGNLNFLKEVNQYWKLKMNSFSFLQSSLQHTPLGLR
jgi:hypothetical protein